MFNQIYKDRIKELDEEIKHLKSDIWSRDKQIIEYKSQSKDDRMAALMRESLGMQVDFASASTDKCLPPHFLEDMKEDERKNFIIAMETIHSDEKFQKVVRYMINLFATNAIYKYDEEQRRNGQIAVVAFRALLKEFDKMHTEFLGYKNKDGEFDNLETMPEV